MLDRPHINEAALRRQEHAKLRRRMEDAVELLLAALDALDGDPDLECGADLEDINEDGGDINDEPHDPESDAEAGTFTPPAEIKRAVNRLKAEGRYRWRGEPILMAEVRYKSNAETMRMSSTE